MTPTPSGGKVFMQDKEKLLELADMITSGKELDTRQKIERSRASASFIDAPSRQSAGKRPKRTASASDKLRGAKDLLLARKSKRKREKTRARKRAEHDSKKDGGSKGNLVDDTTVGRKRVSFV